LCLLQARTYVLQVVDEALEFVVQLARFADDDARRLVLSFDAPGMLDRPQRGEQSRGRR
jgi:hypothetical protein